MKTKKWITYTIYGILITVFFLYVRFPSDSAGRYIRSIVERGNPNIFLLVDSVKLCLPPGIKLSNIEVSFRDKPDLILMANTLKLRPAITSLLSGKLSFLLYADAYEGNMRIDINFTNRFSTKGPVRITTGFNDINLGKCSCIKTAAGRHVDGRLSGSILYNGKWDGVINGAGSANITLLDGNIQLLKNMLGFDGLAFDKAEAELTLKNRTVKITGLDITGKQLSGSFAGNIFLDRDIMQSRLAIKGDLKIPALDKKVSTTLKGTVARPIPGFK
ncbi:MAG: hypothetical protein SRB1_02541 [Desulfobacteraceae bacterium Eth-SRB1]|nr:MAG: hypothetical protein SRB1_02541 [Desulfobacteraceae bacterium Eth-SRB1]